MQHNKDHVDGESVNQVDFPKSRRCILLSAVNKCLDVASTAGAQVLQSLKEITLERLGKDTKNQEKLWFNIKLKLANLFFGTRDFNVLRGVCFCACVPLVFNVLPPSVKPKLDLPWEAAVK